MPFTSRRDFLKSTLGAGLISTLGAPPAGAFEPAASEGEKMRRLAFATYSLHNFFQTSRKKGVRLPERYLTLPEVFELVTERWKIRRFEIHSPHFESTAQTYLDDLKRAMKKYDCSITHIAEVGLNISQRDPERRAADVEGYKKWVDVAAYLGAKTIRINSGKADYSPPDLKITIDSYRAIAAYAASRGLHATIENHWGISENPDHVLKIVEAVGPDLTTSPDFGNFTDYVVDYQALERLFKYAKYVMSCKVFDFNERGEQPFDFPRCMRIMNSSGFRGIVSLEYQGEKDPYEALDRGLALTLKYLEA